MNGYVIGAGALLRTEPRSGIAAAALHAQTDPGIAAGVKAAIVDFESSSSAELSQVLVLAAGWSARRFESEVTLPLLNYGECSLLDVLALLAKATGSSEVHVFARWLPGEGLVAALARFGVCVVAHPLETIAQAALISGGAYTRWPHVVRAA